MRTAGGVKSDLMIFSGRPRRTAPICATLVRGLLPRDPSSASTTPPTGSPAGYLVRVSDGYVRYRNATPVEGTLDPTYVGHWVAYSWDVLTARWRMRQAGASPVIESDDGPALALAPLTADRWITSTGEILDLTGPLPRFANVELHPDRRAGRPGSARSAR